MQSSAYLAIAITLLLRILAIRFSWTTPALRPAPAAVKRSIRPRFQPAAGIAAVKRRAVRPRLDEQRLRAPGHDHGSGRRRPTRAPACSEAARGFQHVGGREQVEQVEALPADVFAPVVEPCASALRYPGGSAACAVSRSRSGGVISMPRRVVRHQAGRQAQGSDARRGAPDQAKFRSRNTGPWPNSMPPRAPPPDGTGGPVACPSRRSAARPCRGQRQGVRQHGGNVGQRAEREDRQGTLLERIAQYLVRGSPGVDRNRHRPVSATSARVVRSTTSARRCPRPPRFRPCRPAPSARAGRWRSSHRGRCGDRGRRRRRCRSTAGGRAAVSAPPAPTRAASIRGHRCASARRERQRDEQRDDQQRGRDAEGLQPPSALNRSATAARARAAHRRARSAPGAGRALGVDHVELAGDAVLVAQPREAMALGERSLRTDSAS